MLRNDSSRIGAVAAVESEKITVDLDPSTSGMVKAGPAGVIGIGRINSYLAIPAGHTTIIAVVTAVKVFADDGGPETRRVSMSRRVVDAVMIGRFDSGRYRPGITTYPSLGEAVRPATHDQIAEIFEPRGTPITLGASVVAPDIDVRLDANALLARHTAVLGTTGSGKSCTVTALLDGLLDLDIPYSNIVIFDANGEYGRAFGPETERGRKADAVVIGPEPGAVGGLFVPHWFMDNEDHLSLLRASEGTQAPLLLRAVADARLLPDDDVGLAALLRHASRNLEDIVALAQGGSSRKPQELLATVLRSFAAGLESIAGNRGESEQELWSELASAAGGWTALGLDEEAWDLPLGLEQRTQLDTLAADIRAVLRKEFDRLGLGLASAASDFDAPRYYSLEALYEMHLPARIEAAAVEEPRMRAYVGPMMMRLARLLADSRYDFMTRVPRHADSLARYLRFVLGWDPVGGALDDDLPPWAHSYSQRTAKEVDDSLPRQHAVTIIDLSHVASDVLETVTAILARLIMGFAQRIEPRASMPILVVLEEAHRYIPASSGDAPSRSAEAFDRIAREGRKFGVSLLLASQRPYELSRTVLSQCGTLIAHRMLNPDDQNLVRHATPFAAREVLRQLPGLATQHAVVLGEAVTAPSYVRVRDIKDPPKSDDPDFIGAWRAGPEDGDQIITQVAREWEQSSVPEQSLLQEASTIEEPEHPEGSTGHAEAGDDPPF